MGITIAYRGWLADLSRLEDFEDRILDYALEVGGLAQIWRSHADDDPRRMVRGVILNLAPGQESVSLLLSPEGWLLGLTDIEDAECGRLTEPPWCFTKTQFGPLESHVALIEMFVALQREFLPNLELSDEGGYYPSGDLAELTRKRSAVQGASSGLAEGLQRHGLSREAAEDPAILQRRLERIAAQVHRILQRPAQHSPLAFPNDADSNVVPDLAATEAIWEEMFKHNRRQQERMQRAIEERLSRGEDDEKAFENALHDLGLEIPGEDLEEPDESWHDDDEVEPFAESVDDDALPDEAGFEDDDTEAVPFGDADDRHPLLQSAMDLLKHLQAVFGDADVRFAGSVRTLFQGAGDVMGGLAQALSGSLDEADLDDYGLRITQLKRALRGAAFARGALFSLQATATPEQLQELRDTLEQMEQEIFHEMECLRAEHRTDDG